MLAVAWENRDRLGYAWRILRHGVCDGCSLGPRGLRDDAMEGIHLCLTRLRMLRLNTVPALDPTLLADVKALEPLDGRALRGLGRLPYAMLRRRGDRGFRRVSWEEALEAGASAIRSTRPDRTAIYTTSRGLTNEVYYVAQKLARLLGTNNVDNAARLCHAASTTALKETLGVGASTNSYSDWMAADWIVLFGTDIANNQPVAMKYFHLARRRGARFAVVNPYREPGLERYWVPSVPRSALLGTSFMDDFFPVAVGGDVPFANGVLKHLRATGGIDRAFVGAHTTGFEALESALDAQTWESLERASGTSRGEMRRFADRYAQARSAVFIWSMGLTQHRFGVENVKAVVNLALARGMVGRRGCGLVPVRGHSGVQGAAECGAVPNALPGGTPLDEANRRRVEAIWTHPVPSSRGLSAAEMVSAAERGELDVLYFLGGNFLETMPEPASARAALARTPCRIHQDLVLNTSMLVEPADVVVLFPARTRYEQEGGGTVTSTERRVRFSPEVPGPRIGEAESEWRILERLGERALPPAGRALFRWKDAQQLREEMERAIPIYAGLSGLRREGDSFQYGGPMLLEGGVCPNLPGGRARFTALVPPDNALPAGTFYLATRRGKQFNTIVWEDGDPLTGSRRRDEVFVSPADAERLGLRGGDPVRLRSSCGEFRGVARIAPVQPGTLQAFWPEANVLLPRRLDPASLEPDYNAPVTLEKG
jgi:molybdopterin-dependent oxidoreductase alpha subunit